jgi:hypothetical protein
MNNDGPHKHSQKREKGGKEIKVRKGQKKGKKKVRNEDTKEIIST